MMRRRRFMGSILGSFGASFLGGKPSIADSPALSPPPAAVSAGFSNLIFADDFDSTPDIGFGTDGHQWNAGLWWESVPSPSCFSVQHGILTITCPDGASDINLCTQSHDYSGGTQFLHGFFEARMRCFDWSAFWLFCWDRPWVFGSKVNPNNPLTWTNEIDILETDPAYPDSVWCTLHANSSGDSVPDQINSNNRQWLNVSPIGRWHNYGLLWTPSELTWYMDGIPMLTVTPYASTPQPVQLILTAAPGGVNGSNPGSPGQTTPPITQIDWVYVWGS